MSLAERNDLLRRTKSAVRSLCPKPLLLWREARYFKRYGERELRLMRHLCARERDAIDVGANEGGYIHFMKRYARRVYAFEPVPWLAEALARKFAPRVVVRNVALSRESGTAVLRIPVVAGARVTGLATLDAAAAADGAFEEIEVRTLPLDEVFAGDAGFIKVDVEGHEEAVLAGAARTIARCRPRLLVEIEESRAPGAVARIRTFLRRFNYRGYFVRDRAVWSIDAFDAETMQRPADIADFGAGAPRTDFDRYVNNFLFLADEEAEPLRARIEATLRRL
ncbi:MAG: FkbM family methyltransferase [Alphaproteobacteria bacterium]|nr:FkbM family methyltransferase [Alphaproteobacteria bacterium]